MPKLILRKEAEDVRSGAVAALPFAVLVVIFQFTAPPSLLQRTVHGDPLVRWLASDLGQWGPVIVSFAIIGFWLGEGLPKKKALEQLLRQAGLGIAVAAGASLLIRLVAGPHLPSFIPPEESARPGLTLGLTAGVVEEALFRLAILPGIYLGLRKKLGEKQSMAVAVLVTALLFAASHEPGRQLGGFDGRLFLARIIIPGIGMSALFFVVSPVFIIALHCSAHLMIPFLFS